MVEVVTLVALALLVGAVVASVVPGVPSGLLALAGVYVEYLFGPGRMGRWRSRRVKGVGVQKSVLKG